MNFFLHQQKPFSLCTKNDFILLYTLIEIYFFFYLTYIFVIKNFGIILVYLLIYNNS